MKRGLRTTHAFILVVLSLTLGFIWTSFFPGAPYEMYSGSVVLAFGGYAGKRLMQKKGEFNEFEGHPEE